MKWKHITPDHVGANNVLEMADLRSSRLKDVGNSDVEIEINVPFFEVENLKEKSSETTRRDSEISVLDVRNSSGRNECRNVMRILANHSLLKAGSSAIGLHRESRRNPMGITVRLLTEENMRLPSVNKYLTNAIERLNREVDVAKIPDVVFGESVEQRLSRLETILANERQEKWEAIENCEKSRVNFVNCERELIRSTKKTEELAKELEKCKAHIKVLEELTQKIKNSRVERERSEESQSSKQSSMKEFRNELKAKREVRQRALSAISAEMNSLREELKKEKNAKINLERQLELQSRNPSNVSWESIISDNKTLRNEIDILTENIERLKDFSSENIRLKYEVKKLNEEIDSLTLNLGELKFEYYEEKRKHERTTSKLNGLQERLSNQSSNEWEEEKENFYKKYVEEKKEIAKRTNALKEVIEITRQMLAIREVQVQDLKTKLKSIEESVKQTKILEENGLKAEYEKQLENIRNLKELYEERVRLMKTETNKLNETLKEKLKRINDQDDEIKNMKSKMEESYEHLRTERQEKESLDSELRLTIARTKDLENELNLINNMFTQMLLGQFNSGNENDLDKLTELLQENHDLITEMISKEESSEIASVLPKLLFDLITQVNGSNEKKDDDVSESSDTISEQSESVLEGNRDAVLPVLSYKNAKLFKTPPQITEISVEGKEISCCKNNENMSPAVQEIASNLPKVWKVLMELLSHHTVPEAPEEPIRGDEKQCYKNVETPYGPRSVISVSKTFLRLKDLILEKKALQKELTRLKQLNSHLENRLDDQEKRLSQVQCELHKTWGIVGRMRAQHQQLHNHEKILRYELQEKRVMLSELKQELEYCRDKWERARQKNDESETEWKKLRKEFAARKTKGCGASELNDSGESGFSDELNESGEDFDADRSSTQSPVDQKLLYEALGTQLDPAVTLKSNSVQELIKQSENNFRQATENVEETELEECLEGTTGIRNSFKAQESFQSDERDKARETKILRLKKLEEQCKLLVRQVDITAHKSNYLNTRLEELHEQYGRSEESNRQCQHSSSFHSVSSEKSSSSLDEKTDDNKTEE